MVENDFQPKLSKNTQKLAENRKKRLEEKQLKQNLPSSSLVISNAQNSSDKHGVSESYKASDKYLLQKFNREFD